MRFSALAVTLSILFTCELGMIGGIPAWAATGGSLLTYGATGADVSVLQTNLQLLGYYPKNEGITTYYGPITRKAVTAFEKDHGLSDTAVVSAAVMADIKTLADRTHVAERKTSAPVRQQTLAERIVQTALTYVGTPYVWGGTTPAGFDCSGFVQYVFAKYGISLPRTSYDQAEAGQYVPKSDLEPGDLVFFDTSGGASHVGIYIGQGKFVNAASTKVEVDYVDDPYYWGSRYLTARNVI